MTTRRGKSSGRADRQFSANAARAAELAADAPSAFTQWLTIQRLNDRTAL
jgi:hypothetical protein